MAAGKSYRPARQGQALTARNLNNNLVRAPMRGQTVTGAGASKRQFPDGVAVDLPDRGGVPGVSNYFRWAIVEDVFNDYIQVKAYNPTSDTTSGSSFNVAKPYLLQQTPFDGQSITYIDGDTITYTADTTNPEYKRTHNDGVSSAAFIVTPNWFIGEQIIIIPLPTFVNGTLYNWVELPGMRYWAEE